jgi:hypothetical protein
MVRQAETLVLISCLASAVLIGTRLQNAAAQSNLTAQTLQDPLKQPVPSLELNNETILDGVAKLNQSTAGVGFAVELPLGRTISAKAPELRRFQVVLAPTTLADILDQFCQLDPTFSWQQFGTDVNVFPRSLMNDPTYVLNRKIEGFNLIDAPDANTALFTALSFLPGPREQIAILQSGMSLSFSRLWTASFKNITIRELLDKIAEQMGGNYGWQFGGAANFRMVTFHVRLGTMPTNNPGQPKPGRVAN